MLHTSIIPFKRSRIHRFWCLGVGPGKQLSMDTDHIYYNCICFLWKIMCMFKRKLFMFCQSP